MTCSRILSLLKNRGSNNPIRLISGFREVNYLEKVGTEFNVVREAIESTKKRIETGEIISSEAKQRVLDLEKNLDRHRGNLFKFYTTPPSNRNFNCSESYKEMFDLAQRSL